MIKKIVYFPLIAYLHIHLWLFRKSMMAGQIAEAEDLLKIYWGKSEKDI